MSISRLLLVVILIVSILPTARLGYTNHSDSVDTRQQSASIKLFSSRISMVKVIDLAKQEFRIMDSTPPSNGTWIINETVIIENQELLLNCSVVINGSGKLVLINSTIILNQTVDGEFSILVKDGGNLTLQHSTITSNDTHKYGIFVVNESFIGIFDSNITNIGLNSTIPGLYIENSTIVTNSFRITDGYVGIYVNNTENLVIENGYISTTESMRIDDSADITIRNMSFYIASGLKGITVDNATRVLITNSSFDSRGSFSISVINSTNINITHCEFQGGPTKQVDVEESSNVFIGENRMRAKDYGVYVLSSNGIIIDSNYIAVRFDVNYDFAPVTTLSRRGVYVEDSANISLINNYFDSFTHATANMPGSPGAFKLYMYGVYLLNASQSWIYSNIFFRYVYFSIPTLNMPYGLSYSAQYNYRGIYLEESIDVGIINNFVGFNSSYIASNDGKSVRFLHVTDSEQILIEEMYLWNISKYQIGDYIYNSNNTVIRDVSYDNLGLTISYSSSITVANISYKGSYSNGLLVDHSDNVTVVNSVFRYGATAIKIYYSSNVSIISSLIDTCEYSFYIRGSSGITINNTDIVNSEIMILDAESFGGISVNDSTYNGYPLVIIGNTAVNIENEQLGALILGYVNGTLKNVSAWYIDIRFSSNLTLLSIRIMSGGEGLIMHDSSNITIEDLIALNSDYGLYLEDVDNATILNVMIYDANYGVFLDSPRSNITLDVAYIEDSMYAVYLNINTNLTLRNSELNGNYVGLMISQYANGSNVVIVNTTFTSNSVSIDIQADAKIVVKLCSITNSEIGISIVGDISVDALIIFNNITNNGYGLIIHSSSVLVYGNIIQNSAVAADRYLNCSFNNSHIGNYWGVEGTDSDMDGIIDYPIIIADVYFDYHALRYEPKIILDGLLIAYSCNNSFINEAYWAYFYSQRALEYSIYDNDSLLLQGTEYVFGTMIPQDHEGLHEIIADLGAPYNTTITLIIHIDITSPNINFLDRNETWINGSQIYLSIADASPIETTIYINDSLLLTTNNKSVVIDIGGFEDATYIIRVYSVDQAGNENISVLLIKVDRTLPHIETSFLNNTYMSNGTVIITLQDNLEISYARIAVNDTVLFSGSIENKTFNYEFDISLLRDGRIILDVFISDKANNTAYAKYVLYIDRTPPELENVVYPENITLPQDYITITIYPTDNLGISNLIVEYSYNESTYEAIVVEKEDYFIALIRVPGTGQIAFNITIVDNAGNQETFGVYEILILSPQTAGTGGQTSESEEHPAKEFFFWSIIGILIAIIAVLGATTFLLWRKYKLSA